MANTALYVVIAYDCPSDKRRNRLAKALKGYGERRQYSLFEARLSKEQWQRLKGKLVKIVDEAEDTLAVYFLPPESVERTLRIGHEAIKPVSEPDFV